jgi:hypothetical protein
VDFHLCDYNDCNPSPPGPRGVKLDSRRMTLLLALGLMLAALVLLLISAATPPAIIVKWDTASELNTAGFNVLRGDNPDGPFTRLNLEVIPTSLDPLVGGSYVFTDTHVALGQTYYYRVEEVEFGGNTLLQSDMDVVTLQGPDPILIAAGLALIVAIIAVLFWIERPRRASPQP